MRIVVENSGYELLNLGDVAMLQVAIRRLRGMWPDAEIHVMTSAPRDLERYCPGTIPLDPAGRDFWLRNGNVMGTAFHRAPRRARGVMSRIERFVRRRYPARVRGVIERRLARRGEQDMRMMDAYLDAVLNADLVLATGGGYFTDCFDLHAYNLMETLLLGLHRGAATALLGQGIGPITRAPLLRRMRSLLPSVDLIALREDRNGAALLRGLGVDAARMMTTGDDAIEAAVGGDSICSKRDHPTESRQSGKATHARGAEIGINLRTASYADVPNGAMEIVGATLGKALKRPGACLVPLPISRHDDGEDARAIEAVMKEVGVCAARVCPAETPQDLIDRMAECRIVVTGSYHAGVFAMAQGIPTVALVRSAYYVDKFAGLARQFGVAGPEQAGCELVMLDAGDLSIKLESAMERAWSAADSIAPKLREAARRQVEQSQTAYRRLAEICAK